jgi:hypothetical protein
MKRREFVFGSLTAAALFSPSLAARRASAQGVARPKRLFVNLTAAGYPDAAAFFPTGSETSWQLSPILAQCAAVKDAMVVIDGVDIRDSGYNAAGANHARAPGKILTAKDVIDDGEEGLIGDRSIDQLLVQELGVQSLEVVITNDRLRSVRNKPFGSAPAVFKNPLIPPSAAWDKAFNGFTAEGDPVAAREATLRRLRARRSLLDGLGSDLRRLRAELSGAEKLKLDVHEDSIRRAEASVAADLTNVPPPAALCQVPGRPRDESYIPTRSQAHLDVMFAAFACDRIRVGSALWGGSGVGGTEWNYVWLPNTDIPDLHNDVHHNAGARRDDYIKCAAWDWSVLAKFVERLRNTPDGDGSMLDSTLVLSLSMFSRHHHIDRLPIVLFGSQKYGLRTDRYLKLPSTIHNDKVLTSVAQLMGANVNGIGDDLNCGPVPGLL